MPRRKQDKKRRRRGERTAEPRHPVPPSGLLQVLTACADRLTRTRWVLPAALAAFTLAVYARSVTCPLVHWDDYSYLYEDTRIQRLSLANIWSILTGSFACNYHPLTTLTFAFDRAVWGERLWGFHLTQLAFYAGGVTLLYYLFLAILGSAPAALAGALIYATHTIHVESVVWLASRKDVVCLFFYAAAMLAYVRYAREENRSAKRYALFVALATAAMFSKGYAAVLPAVFLAYDACFAKRIRPRHLLEKVPLFAIALGLTVVMITAQEKAASPVSAGVAFWHRFLLLCKIYAAYVGRTILPVRLSVDYCLLSPWPRHGVAVLGAILASGTVASFFLLRRRLPAASFGIAIFLLQLSTVMSTFFTLRQWMTDRYLFFPTIGSTLALAAGGLWLYRRKALPAVLPRWAIPASAVAAVALYSALTIERTGVWRSEVDIWSDAVRKQLDLRGSGPLDPRELEGQQLCTIGSLIKLASAYERAGESDKARAVVKVVEELPEGFKRGNEIGLMGLAERDIRAARYDRAIDRLLPVAKEGKWGAASAWVSIGNAYKRKGDRGEARAAYEKALESYRKSGRSGTRAMIELGTLEFEAGRFEAAASWYRRAREHARPTDPHPTFCLALALERAGQFTEARRLCGEVLELEHRVSPTTSFDFTDVCLEMGIVAEKLGRPEEAAESFEEVLRRSPGHPQREAIRAKIQGLRTQPSAQ